MLSTFFQKQNPLRHYSSGRPNRIYRIPKLQFGIILFGLVGFKNTEPNQNWSNRSEKVSQYVLFDFEALWVPSGLRIQLSCLVSDRLQLKKLKISDETRNFYFKNIKSSQQEAFSKVLGHFLVKFLFSNCQIRGKSLFSCTMRFGSVLFRSVRIPKLWNSVFYQLRSTTDFSYKNCNYHKRN